MTLIDFRGSMMIETRIRGECKWCGQIKIGRILLANDAFGNPVRHDPYACFYCFKCWNESYPKLKKYRAEHPHNNRVRSKYDGSPCIICGFYIKSIWNGICHYDKKCFREAKKLGVCPGVKSLYEINRERDWNGIHQYEKFNWADCMEYDCKLCGHKFTIKKPKITRERISIIKSIRIYGRVSLGILRHKCFQRDEYRCVECGATNKDTKLEADHILPVSKGGMNHLDNLQTLCITCNRTKHTDHWRGGFDERSEEEQN